MIKRGKLACFLLIILVLVTLYIYKLQLEILSQLSTDFSTFDNVVGSSRLIVPNIIHFVHFDEESPSFVTFICILSAWYNHKPSNIYIHTNVKHSLDKSRYIRTIKSVIGTSLKIRELSKPTHVYGQKLSSVQHSSDVARLKILMKYGGIYLDEDVYVVKNLNVYRHFECSIGWPENQNIGSQIILAHKEARFIKLWMQLYREYRPTMWYYNAGEAPTSLILKHRPDLVHRVKLDFGVENLSEELYGRNWTGWINRYTVHLLSNHKYLHNTSLDEQTFQQCNCTFATLANQIIANLEEDHVNFKLKTDSRSQQIELDQQVNRFLSSNSSSLLKKYLSPQLFNELKSLKTDIYGSTLKDVIKTGLANPDSSVGIFAPDPEAYKVFRKLFLPVIQDYHKIEVFQPQPESYWGDVKDIGKFGNEVISTRIRIARSLAGFPLNSKMTKKHLRKLELRVTNVLKTHFSGEYKSLAKMSQKEKKELLGQHLLFENCDRFTVGGGGCSYWPDHRGIFLSSDRQLIIWVNEEDHLRIISLEEGGDLQSVYSRLVNAVSKLEKHLSFVHDPEFGFLTFCPTNIGTTLRASVHMQFTTLTSHEIKEKSKELGLQVRGTSGEHTKVQGGIYDLSNRKRFGINEYQAVREMYDGISTLLKLDRKEANST